MYAENMKLEFLLQPKISRPRRNFVPILAVFSSCLFDQVDGGGHYFHYVANEVVTTTIRLRFDGRLTAYGRSSRSQWRSHADLFIYLFIYLGRSAAAYNTYSLRS